MAKVQVIVTDENGKEIPFNTKTLTKEFQNKEGKKYKVAIEEPGHSRINVGEYTVQGSVTPPPPPPPPPPVHECPEGKHWDEATQQCIDNPPPPPPPTTDLLYDSNTDIKWSEITGEFLKVTDVYGNFVPNGKYFRMKASGSPRMYLYPATKELVLEHDGKYGRAYFGVCNYQSRLECEFKLENANHNASFKTRNRHQFADIQSGAADKQRQGGQGSAFHVDSVDADLEVVHGTEMSGPSSNISPKLEVGKYYKIRFSQFDKNGRIHIIDELDRNDGQGFKVVNEGDIAAPAQFFNRGEFETWSEFWVRLNADNGGKLWFKNLRMYKL